MTNSSIEWTDVTWNPVRGCSRVSEGCRNCYAERTAARFANPPDGPWRDGFVRITNGHPQWTGKVELIESKLDEPLRMRKPRRIFVNSMSDLFHEALSDSDIFKVFLIMAASERHTFQVLTKRPQRMLDWINSASGQAFPRHFMNVWLGVSVEDQATADERIPLLLQTPAAVRFVSYEPALEAVDFCNLNFKGRYLNCLDTFGPDAQLPDLNWIIVGGESGPGARPFDVAWARNTVEQCEAAGVACFVKQLGAKPFEIVPHEDYDWEPKDLGLSDRKGGDWHEWPQDLRVRQFPDLKGAVAV